MQALYTYVIDIIAVIFLYDTYCLIPISFSYS